MAPCAVGAGISASAGMTSADMSDADMTSVPGSNVPGKSEAESEVARNEVRRVLRPEGERVRLDTTRCMGNVQR